MGGTDDSRAVEGTDAGVLAADRFAGCLLGLALGDALGAPFEGGPLERLLWRALGTTRSGQMRWTDDTQMTLDLAASLVACGEVDPEHLARQFARGYRWSRGYGPGTARVLKRVARGAPWQEAAGSVYPGGSFGNGGAMRAPAVGLFYANRPDELPPAARAAAAVTHAHPQALAASVVIARVTAQAVGDGPAGRALDAAIAVCDEVAIGERLERAQRLLADDPASPRAVAERLGNGTAAVDSCATAVYLYERFKTRPFVELIDFTRRCGGDVDTIGAMSGALWGAANGAVGLPADAVRRLEAAARIRATAGRLHEQMCGPSTRPAPAPGADQRSASGTYGRGAGPV